MIYLKSKFFFSNREQSREVKIFDIYNLEVSFFIPPDIVPARIVLLVTLCLVLINMFNSTT